MKFLKTLLFFICVFAAANVTDENPRTYWVAGSNQPGEWLNIDLGRICDLRAIQINFTDYKSGIYSNGPNIYTQFKLHASGDGTAWTTVADLTGEKRDRPNAYLELPPSTHARFVKFEHIYVGAPNLAISDVRYTPIYMHYEWTAAQAAADNTNARSGLHLYPLEKATQAMIDAQQLKTSVQAQRTRIQSTLNADGQSIPLVDIGRF